MVTYYRLSGLAPAALLKGTLPPNLTRILGGDQPIVANSVYETLRSFLFRFSVPLKVMVTEGTLPNGMLNTSHTVNYYPVVGSPDVNIHYKNSSSVDAVLFRGIHWVNGYNLSYTSISERGHILNPTIWRSVTKDDIYSPYFNGTIVNIYDFDAEQAQQSFIGAMRFISERGLPEGFIVARTAIRSTKIPGSCDSSMSVSWDLLPREIEVILLVIENVSDRLLQIGDFESRELGGLDHSRNVFKEVVECKKRSSRVLDFLC